MGREIQEVSGGVTFQLLKELGKSTGKEEHEQVPWGEERMENGGQRCFDEIEEISWLASYNQATRFYCKCNGNPFEDFNWKMTQQKGWAGFGLK